jgi:hypothetical protein
LGSNSKRCHAVASQSYRGRHVTLSLLFSPFFLFLRFIWN